MVGRTGDLCDWHHTSRRPIRREVNREPASARHERQRNGVGGNVTLLTVPRGPMMPGSETSPGWPGWSKLNVRQR